MMARYRNSTTGCDHDISAPCKACANAMRGTVKNGLRKPAVILFRPAFYEHVSLDGVQCDTPQQLAKACKDNGKTSVYLRDFGSLWRTERKEI